MRRVLIVLAGLLLALGLVGPADAATRHSPPSKPRHVAASTDGEAAGVVRVSWKAPKDQGRSPVLAYAVTYATGSAKPTWVLVDGSQRSVRISGLESGQSYVVRVAALNRWGLGPWARVRVDVGQTRHEELFAVNETDHTLVRLHPDGTSPATVVLSDVSGATDLEIDHAGNAYVAASGSVTKVPVSGSPSVVGPGTQVESDDAGNVYLGSTAGVVEIRPDGTSTTITTSEQGDNLAVDGEGTVTVSTRGYDHVLTTYKNGAPAVTRSLSNTVRSGQILAGTQGTIYANANSGGGASYSYWVRLAAGSETPVGFSTHLAEYGGAVAPDGSFYLAESASFCPAISEDSGGCVPDRRVVDVAHYAADGTLVGTVPTSGFSTRRSFGVDVAVDSTGALFAADRGDNPKLVRVAPTGGAAQPVADGVFSVLAVG